MRETLWFEKFLSFWAAGIGTFGTFTFLLQITHDFRIITHFEVSIRKYAGILEYVGILPVSMRQRVGNCSALFCFFVHYFASSSMHQMCKMHCISNSSQLQMLRMKPKPREKELTQIRCQHSSMRTFRCDLNNSKCFISSNATEFSIKPKNHT